MKSMNVEEKEEKSKRRKDKECSVGDCDGTDTYHSQVNT